MGTIHALQIQSSNSRPVCLKCVCGLTNGSVQILDGLQRATSWNIRSLLEKESIAGEFPNISIKFGEIDQLPMNVVFSRKFTPDEEGYQLFAITVLILNDLVPRGISLQLGADNMPISLIARKEDHKVCEKVLLKLAAKLTEAHGKGIIVFPALFNSRYDDE